MTVADATTAFIVLASVQGVVTLVLAVATGFYAWRTHDISKATKEQAGASIEMAREMHEQRLESVRPVLSVEHRIRDGKVGNAPSVAISPRNIGPGVALKIECAFEHPRFAYSPLWWAALGPQESCNDARLYRRAADDRNDADAAVGTLAPIVLTYEDIFGRLFETRVTLEQDLLGWKERGTHYRLIASQVPEDREPPSANVWHELKVTRSGSITEDMDDP